MSLSSILSNNNFTIYAEEGIFRKLIANIIAAKGTLSEWDSTLEYDVNNFVMYNGIIWRSLFGSNLNNTPSLASTFWVVAINLYQNRVSSKEIIVNQDDGSDDVMKENQIPFQTLQTALAYASNDSDIFIETLNGSYNIGTLDISSTDQNIYSLPTIERYNNKLLGQINVKNDSSNFVLNSLEINNVGSGQGSLNCYSFGPTYFQNCFFNNDLDVDDIVFDNDSDQTNWGGNPVIFYNCKTNAQIGNTNNISFRGDPLPGTIVFIYNQRGFLRLNIQPTSGNLIIAVVGCDSCEITAHDNCLLFIKGPTLMNGLVSTGTSPGSLLYITESTFYSAFTGYSILNKTGDCDAYLNCDFDYSTAVLNGNITYPNDVSNNCIINGRLYQGTNNNITPNTTDGCIIGSVDSNLTNLSSTFFENLAIVGSNTSSIASSTNQTQQVEACAVVGSINSNIIGDSDCSLNSCGIYSSSVGQITSTNPYTGTLDYSAILASHESTINKSSNGPLHKANLIAGSGTSTLSSCEHVVIAGSVDGVAVGATNSLLCGNSPVVTHNNVFSVSGTSTKDNQAILNVDVDITNHNLSCTGGTGTFQNLVVTGNLISGATAIYNLETVNNLVVLNGFTGATGSFDHLTTNNNFSFAGASGNTAYINNLYLGGVSGNTGNFNYLNVNNNLSSNSFTGNTGTLSSLNVGSSTGNTGNYNYLNVNNNLSSNSFTGNTGTLSSLNVGSSTGNTGNYNYLNVNNSLSSNSFTGNTGSFNQINVGGISGNTAYFENLSFNSGFTGGSGSFSNLNIQNQLTVGGDVYFNKNIIQNNQTIDANTTNCALLSSNSSSVMDSVSNCASISSATTNIQAYGSAVSNVIQRSSIMDCATCSITSSTGCSGGGLIINSGIIDSSTCNLSIISASNTSRLNECTLLSSNASTIGSGNTSGWLIACSIIDGISCNIVSESPASANNCQANCVMASNSSNIKLQTLNSGLVLKDSAVMASNSCNIVGFTGSAGLMDGLSILSSTSSNINNFGMTSGGIINSSIIGSKSSFVLGATGSTGLIDGAVIVGSLASVITSGYTGSYTEQVIAASNASTLNSTNRSAIIASDSGLINTGLDCIISGSSAGNITSNGNFTSAIVRSGIHNSFSCNITSPTGSTGTLASSSIMNSASSSISSAMHSGTLNEVSLIGANSCTASLGVSGGLLLSSGMLNCASNTLTSEAPMTNNNSLCLGMVNTSSSTISNLSLSPDTIMKSSGLINSHNSTILSQASSVATQITASGMLSGYNSNIYSYGNTASGLLGCAIVGCDGSSIEGSSGFTGYIDSNCIISSNSCNIKKNSDGLNVSNLISASTSSNMTSCNRTTICSALGATANQLTGCWLGGSGPNASSLSNVFLWSATGTSNNQAKFGTDFKVTGAGNNINVEGGYLYGNNSVAKRYDEVALNTAITSTMDSIMITATSDKIMTLPAASTLVSTYPLASTRRFLFSNTPGNTGSHLLLSGGDTFRSKSGWTQMYLPKSGGPLEVIWTSSTGGTGTWGFSAPVIVRCDCNMVTANNFGTTPPKANASLLPTSTSKANHQTLTTTSYVTFDSISADSPGTQLFTLSGQTVVIPITGTYVIRYILNITQTGVIGITYYNLRMDVANTTASTSISNSYCEVSGGNDGTGSQVVTFDTDPFFISSSTALALRVSQDSVNGITSTGSIIFAKMIIMANV